MAKLTPGSELMHVSESLATDGSQSTGRPVFGFVLLGDALTGARVRDVYLLNELVRKGYECHVWWAHERDRDAGIDPSVPQRWFFHHARIAGYGQNLFGQRLGRGLEDRGNRIVSRLAGEQVRNFVRTRYPQVIDWGMKGVIREVVAGVHKDQRLLRRFTRELDAAGVTHVFPMLSILAPWCRAACEMMQRPAEYVITFQGYELFAAAARQAGLEGEFYHALRDVAEASTVRPIAVSRQYAERIEREIGIAADSLQIVPPGVPLPEPFETAKAQDLVRSGLGITDFDTPIVSFVGRQDSEKGIDLLLYAAKIARERGHRLQVAIAGANGFGLTYQKACQQIAGHLQLDVNWHNRIPLDVRNALMQVSRCVVYPSIHEEPFGLVPVEAMAMGTPAIVPDRGGISELVDVDGEQAGLRFQTWNAGDLADQLGDVLGSEELYQSLCSNTRDASHRFSLQACAHGVLNACGIETSADEEPSRELVAAA